MISRKEESQSQISKWVYDLATNCFNDSHLVQWQMNSEFDNVVTYSFTLVQKHLALEIDGYLTKGLPALPTTAEDVIDFIASGNLGQFSRTLIRAATSEEQAIAHVPS